MHDIDRTQRELEQELEAELEGEHHTAHEGEHEGEGEGEAFLGSVLGEGEHEGEHEATHAHVHEAESPLSEAQEMELASELLEVTSEAELEYFFGSLARRVARGVKNFARSSVGKRIGGALRSIAKRALPMAATALGGLVGGPIGGKVGSALGNFASSLFELELEGLSHEDREFEIARQLVRFGAAAMDRGARAPRNADPRLTAQRALASAARVYAPGLVRRGRLCSTCAPGQRGRGRAASAGRRWATDASAPAAASASRGTPRSVDADGDPALAPVEAASGGAARGGRWVRRGDRIILMGA
jgi:uncharacterized protein (DUF697 family)